MTHAKRILVIDDEKVVCNSCRRVLEEEGFDVSVAAGGQEGVERVSQENFDVVIVDIRMPGVGGMDVLRIIRRRKPDARTIVITGYPSVGSAAEAMQLGATDYLPKPFTPTELSDRVKRVFQPVGAAAQPQAREKMLFPERMAGLEAEEAREGAGGEAQILLAGSDTEEIEVLRQCLLSEPWQVSTVEKVEEIMGMIRAGDADVLITGVDVFGVKVYDLISRVRKLGSKVPIIVACSDPSVELARKIRESGIFFYLMEPFDPEEVRAAVRDAVRKAARLRREISGAPAKSTLVRSVRTVSKKGTKVGFVAMGELVDQESSFYREIVGELKRRSMPMHMELARRAVNAKEFPRYLEQDDRVVIVVPFEARVEDSRIVSYSAGEFEGLATREQRKTLREIAYPEVLYWLRAQGVAPEVRIVWLPGKHLGSEQAGEAAGIVVKEGLA